MSTHQGCYLFATRVQRYTSYEGDRISREDFFEIVNLKMDGHKTGWPLVGNEGMKPYMVMMGIHSLIPY